MAIPVSPIALPIIPDSLTIPQFFLDTQNSELASLRLKSPPYLIEDKTGRKVGLEEVGFRNRASLLHSPSNV